MFINEKEENNLVWYAAYGSNMLWERFRHYLEGGSFRGQGTNHSPCINPALPQEKRAILLPYPMYFANHSGSWEGKGVSFLDVHTPGQSMGVCYLITQQQLDHIYREENGGFIPSLHSTWYNLLHPLGDLDGHPVYTITNRSTLTPNAPGERYLKVLTEGLSENYPHLAEEEIKLYLKKCQEYDG